MQCPQCRGEAADDAAFCTHCGSQLQLRCHRCGALSPADSRYCRACGTSISSQEGTDGTSSVPPGPAPTGLLCPRCNSTNEPGSQYCFGCGLPIEESRARSAPAQPYGAATDTADRAGFWVRLAASLVDSIILVFVLLALQAVFVDGAFSNSADEAASNVVSTVNFVINVAYFGTLVAISQATLGKRVFGLYIVRPDGSRVGFGRAVARYFATLLSAAILLIGFIMIGLRRDKRGLHDLICDTVVLRR